jgi:hypothetical protein
LGLNRFYIAGKNALLFGIEYAGDGTIMAGIKINSPYPT